MSEIVTIEQLRHELAGGKYTKWAVDLTGEQLVGLIWLVGEFSMRAHLPTRRKTRHETDQGRIQTTSGIAQ